MLLFTLFLSGIKSKILRATGMGELKMVFLQQMVKVPLAKDVDYGQAAANNANNRFRITNNINGMKINIYAVSNAISVICHPKFMN